MKYLNVFELVEEQHRPNDPKVAWFQMEPGTVYPVVIAHIQDVLETPGFTPPDHLGRHFGDAKKVPDEGWEAALKAKDDVPPELHQARYDALECARLWFTASLHAAIGGAKMGLHITKDEQWRL